MATSKFKVSLWIEESRRGDGGSVGLKQHVQDREQLF
jgi:hypothetical protein